MSRFFPSDGAGEDRKDRKQAGENRKDRKQTGENMKGRKQAREIGKTGNRQGKWEKQEAGEGK